MFCIKISTVYYSVFLHCMLHAASKVSKINYGVPHITVNKTESEMSHF